MNAISRRFLKKPDTSAVKSDMSIVAWAGWREYLSGGFRPGRRIILVILCWSGLVWLHSTPVCACSCMPIGSPQEALEEVDAVFVGTVTELFRWPGGGGIAFFRVEEAWKGVTRTSVTVSTGPNGIGGCGYSFYGGSFLVYAYREGGQLTTSICTRTAPLSEAAEDLAYLGTQPSIELAPTVSPLILLLALFLTIEIGVIVVSWWQYRQEHPPGAGKRPSVALGALIGAAIGAALTVSFSGLVSIALTSRPALMPSAEVAATLISNFLGGAIMGATLGILVELSTEQAKARSTILKLGAAIGLFVGPIVLMLYGSISTLIVLTVLNLAQAPEAFAGNQGCLCGPVIGLISGLLIAAVTVWLSSRDYRVL